MITIFLQITPKTMSIYHSGDYVIRPMTRLEVDLAIEWAAAAGWNPGLRDGDCFYKSDPAGFLVGLKGGEPVATLSAVKYGETFGFIGFYIVKPEHRGQGYGMQIWNAGLAYLGVEPSGTEPLGVASLGTGRTVGLDGVVDQQDNYRKSGFTLAYSNVRYQGAGGGAGLNDDDIVPLATLPFEQVIAYDRSFFPGDRAAPGSSPDSASVSPQRRRFLQCWVAQPHIALGLMQNGELLGYGVLRRCRLGHKIGPLFADSPEIADRLFAALRGQALAEDPIFLDVPAVNAAAVDLARRYGMTAAFETARMYIGPAPDLPMNRLFGVTSFELG